MGAHKELFIEWLDKEASPEVRNLPILGQQLAYAKWCKERELTVWTEPITPEQTIVTDMSYYEHRDNK